MKIAFLDRDGVINTEVNYLHKIEDFEFTNNCISGLKRIVAHEYKIIIVTNQAGIAKGLYSVDAYNKLTTWYREKLLAHGIDVLDIYFCPHHPDGVIPEYGFECHCRKPKAGMLELAAQKYSIDMDNSFIVGDKISDLEAGIAFGLSKVYMVETGHNIPRQGYDKYQVYPDLLSIPL